MGHFSMDHFSTTTSSQWSSDIPWHLWSSHITQYLQALGLLPDLHDVLAPQLPLSALVVFQLVGELGLVLEPDQLAAHLLDGAEMAELQLLHGLVLTQQHGVLQVLLCLPFV